MPPRNQVRPEIQALRAVAVLLVVVYHVWPQVIPGGFAGVDVFFAISGYLITAHLLREVRRDGRISLPRFWARRARRLLPAALTVLLFCLVATLALIPAVHWDQFLTEIGASTLYVQNWQLAADAVDYLAADNSPSPAQHYWSLALEEQFYVLWPILILGGVALARGRSAKTRLRAIAAVLAVVTAASLLNSILATASDPAWAYFVTPTRAWEFGAGGLLAVLGAPLRLPAPVRAVLSWSGLAAITVAAFAFNEGTAFPGSAALLPILGALAVIAAGAPVVRGSPLRAMRVPAVQDLGRISYSVYLWHWPLIVFAPFVVSGGGLPVDVVIVVLTIGAAALTTRFIEDPVRRSALLTARRPRLTFAAAVGAMALVVIPVAGASRHVEDEVDDAVAASEALVASDPECFGAAARDPQRPCENPRLRDRVAPLPLAAAEEPNAPCRDVRRTGPVSVCEFGTKDDDPRRSVALLGDSHAAHWRGALQDISDRERWRGHSITRTSCPFSQAGRPLSRKARSRCLDWNDAIPRWFKRHPEVDTAFVAANTGGEVDVPKGKSPLEAEVAGYRAAWRSLPASVKHIIVLRDTPKARSATVDCIDAAISDGQPAGPACAVPRARALENDPAAVAAERGADTRARVVDLNHTICTATACLPVVGGALVYKDEHHLTQAFSQSLGRQLLRAVREQTGVG